MIHHLVERLKSIVPDRKYKFVVAKDNYFTIPNIMPILLEMEIGCVGWPPAELKASDNPMYNDLTWFIDNSGTLVVRWVDNNLVLAVSTVHAMPNNRTRQKTSKTE